MEKKFTQGEWKYEFNGTYFDVRGKDRLSPNIAVFTNSIKDHPTFDPINLCEIDEAEANAKLIAAAPDMINFLLKIKENEYLSKELEAFFEDELSSIIKSATT